MYQQSVAIKPPYYENVPIIDGEFDDFEINNELELQLRESDAANFYHDALDIAE